MSRYDFRNMADVKQRNAELGHHFFDADTMRFFQSRVGNTLYCGRYFITSERNEGTYYDTRAREYVSYDYGRKYSVRKALPTGEIVDVSGFQAFDSRAQAVRFIDQLAKRAATIRKEH